MKRKIESSVRKIFAPFVELLVKLRINPNFLSFLGLILSLFTAYLYKEGNLRLGGLFVLISGIFDAVDGEVARRMKKSSSKGALLDSTLDRISEFILFGGLLLHFSKDFFPFIVLYLSLLFSVTVSYLRARGEGLGISVKGGPMDRASRYLFLAFASILGGRFFIQIMVIFVLLTAVTVVRRWKSLYNFFDKRESTRNT